MNAQQESLSAPDLDGEAAAWLFERDEGFTAERAAEFAAWCRASPDRARAVARMERTWALLEEGGPTVREPLEARMVEMQKPLLPGKTHRKSKVIQLAWLGGLAAALLLGGLLWRGDYLHDEQQHYLANNLARRTLVLSDGSIIDLNTDSEIATHFTRGERHLTLLKGEAHFQVAHDTARPFIVTTGDISVRAVGTAFNVRMESSVLDVIVTEGKIAVDQKSPAVPGPVAAELKAGERVEVPRDHPVTELRVEKVDPEVMQTILTWQNPRTDFSGVPLRDVIIRFNRRNVIQLVLEDAELGDRKIGGTLVVNQVDAFVRLLEQDGDIVADHATAGQIGLRRAR